MQDNLSDNEFSHLRSDQLDSDPDYEHFSGNNKKHRHSSSLHFAPPNSVQQAAALKRQWIFAGLAMILALICFVIQTETAKYIQGELGWAKPFAMLYITHSSFVFVMPLQFLIIRFKHRHENWKTVWNHHTKQMKQIAHLIMNKESGPVLRHMSLIVVLITTCLTISACTWYLAVNLTTTSDVSAIYNASVFFAYMFSIPILGDKIRKDKLFAVIMSIFGVVIISYGSHSTTSEGENIAAHQRVLGNIIMSIGSVGYGLNEVLYKKFACPPNVVSATKSVLFANWFTWGIGICTFTVLWIPLLVLHIVGLEVMVVPDAYTSLILFISLLSNMLFSAAFLIVVSLTSPVLSSVANMLSIFMVAIVDVILTREAFPVSDLIGGSLIVMAFVILTWASYVEMKSEQKEDDSEDDGFSIDDNESETEMLSHEN